MTILESKYIRQEYIVRDMQLFSEVKLTRRGLVRYIALSLGLISPKETRALIIDIFDALLKAHFSNEEPDMNRIMELVNEVRKSETPAQIKAVRYHIHQLKEKGILERKVGRYKFALPPMAENSDLADAFEYLYLTNTKNAFDKIRKAITSIKNMY